MAVTPQAQEVFEALFGAPPERHATDPELYELLQNFIFDDIFSTGVLTHRQRELITVSVLTALQAVPQLKAHAEAALCVGCTPLELREAVYLCAPFVGFPKALNAVSALNEVFEANGIALPLPAAGKTARENRQSAGHALQEPLYGTEIADGFAALPGEFSKAVPRFLTELCFGDFETRGALDVKTRELLGLCVLAALGAVPQTAAHARGAQRAGNSKLELTAALVQALPYIGFPFALNALRDVMVLEDAPR